MYYLDCDFKSLHWISLDQLTNETLKETSSKMLYALAHMYVALEVVLKVQDWS
jgi:hypothetical protein